MDNKPVSDSKGNNFNSIKECAAYYGIPFKLLSARLAGGMTVDDAVAMLHRPQAITYNGVTYRTKTELCRAFNIPYDRFRSRIRKGWSLDDALNTPMITSLKFTQDEFNTKLRAKFGTQYTLMEPYNGMRQPTHFLCRSCNHIFRIAPTDLFGGHSCPNCRKSSYERAVEAYLDYNEIPYISQSTNHTCLTSKGGKARFDFEIPCKGFIEVDGEGHFQKVLNWSFVRAYINDNIKTAFCEANNIPLLRIKYTQILDGTYTDIIDSFMSNPSYYITNHNTYLSNKAYNYPRYVTLCSL